MQKFKEEKIEEMDLAMNQISPIADGDFERAQMKAWFV